MSVGQFCNGSASNGKNFQNRVCDVLTHHRARNCRFLLMLRGFRLVVPHGQSRSVSVVTKLARISQS